MSKINADVLNAVLRLNGGTRYLEIGIQGGDTFRRVKADLKVGVDPHSKHATYRMTSDRFFAREMELSLGNPDPKFDLVFVDGLHEQAQVMADVNNSLRYLSPRGIVIVDDTMPRNASEAAYPQPKGQVAWCGTVWQAALCLRSNQDLDCRTLDEKRGYMAVLPRENTDRIQIADLTFAEFQQHRSRYLGVVRKRKAWLDWIRKRLSSPRTAVEAHRTPDAAEP